MTPEQTKGYQYWRAQGVPARTAYAWAQQERYDYADGDKIEWHGATIELSVSYDDWPDMSWLGEFSDSWEPGAIDHEPSNSRTFRYFIPANRQNPADFSRLGYARHEAWLRAERAARDDYERACDYESYLLKARIVLDGNVIGESALYGVDLDTRTVESRRHADEYVAYMFGSELIPEAKEDALAHLEESARALVTIDQDRARMVLATLATNASTS